ncbi:MAG: RidA family protein [Phycisphaeraceae bacterium]|nr:RidA family protein [Phycisphaeraceae bacterium]
MERVYTGSPWEQSFGYCRAIRAGNLIFVGGTAPVADGGGTHAPGDAAAQTARCYHIIETALSRLGLDHTCLTRVRLYVTDIARADEIGQAHRDFFRAHHPCMTMVEVRALIAPDMLVEIEAEGVIEQSR